MSVSDLSTSVTLGVDLSSTGSSDVGSSVVGSSVVGSSVVGSFITGLFVPRFTASLRIYSASMIVTLPSTLKSAASF